MEELQAEELKGDASHCFAEGGVREFSAQA
jgi:hypothetical protein